MHLEVLLQTVCLWKDVSFSLSSVEGMIQFAQQLWLQSTFANQQNSTNYCHFCQEAGALSVLLFHVSMFCKILTHTALRIWKSSCCSGVSFGKWHGWSLTEMKYLFYSKCQSCSIFLKENMMPKLAARWDLGELLEESSFGYEINAKWDVHWWERGM